MKKNKQPDLKPSISTSYFLDCESVTQIIHFKDGIKRTFTGILPDTLKQGQFTKMSLLLCCRRIWLKLVIWLFLHKATYRVYPAVQIR